MEKEDMFLEIIANYRERIFPKVNFFMIDSFYICITEKNH